MSLVFGQASTHPKTNVELLETRLQFQIVSHNQFLERGNIIF